ncbi:MAG: DNA methyltransferase [Stygiobacter sp. RIFOXYC12_FULL_38_8]|nr:MAG: DNA methyltransferase [Stygiobacter sp. GWC2_38_9]OGV09628.1 MAG: DNA methyltransferase [Stygiobacter sp. RIFOXYB2_FULL_37_11]OGV16758.1 MAG: DNA methyltransferase [Stygiobacter sp. RIFOXYC2_FULL_38_25]OGV18116.1 MAG: DNA methyltransferase [Stygiobacter sp. RIFOXYA2_FULL_38_8]OGV29453.1 MAG: DNA methyltransferase [Stygiobacter sp. RIFOXYC12_FULL_38_8]OGV82891.1 MAG: DNA methyltransferase [Stygiobacter sp. GWF2_38_21]RJQ61654.1 MAG: SAM-dependent DNA methyltransferase [Stygiobacter sp.
MSLEAQHQSLIDFIFKLANKLRGPYRPPQYRKVMLPLTVLRRLDLVTSENKAEVLTQLEKLKARGLKGNALHEALARYATKNRKQPLYNISKYTLAKLLEDSDHIAKNLIAYINGFSPKAKEIFGYFKFEEEIATLENSNRLYLIIKDFCDPQIDLHPNRVSNLQMGYIFEELIRKFNEQANEEAGDHFTPREVIELMTHIIYTNEDVIYKEGIARTIYDPACGTGGMLSVSEKYIHENNDKANLTLYGQEYNNESYAICTSDLLIKDEEVSNIAFGDTLGDGKTSDGHKDKTFHYMLANPPFGVEWEPEKQTVEKEYKDLGFDGRFGPGLPRSNDGSFLFLLHMISKMKPYKKAEDDGSKIAIIFNGSPLFTGDAGSGESNIRRWIIENDWLDAIIALPDQLFYNTGIFTYIWFLTNRKPLERKGKVQLIDGTKHFKKMDKSLGNKRNELSPDHITELTKLYAEYKNNAASFININGQPKEKVCGKIFDNREFGYIKVTVERPLRLNFLALEERITKLYLETAFINLAESKKKKDSKKKDEEVEEGIELQQKIIACLKTLESTKLYKNQDEFILLLDKHLNANGLKLKANLFEAILNALSEKDETADICYDSKGNPEPDSDLRDNENISLPNTIPLPLPLDYDKKASLDKLLPLIKEHCEEYMKAEVLPHVPDAWIDFSKTKIGYEIPINRHFYVYEQPRDLDEIEKDIKRIEKDILEMLNEVVE